MPGARQLLPLEPKFEMPLAISRFRIELRHPGTAVPHHDRSAAILALRNHAFEIAIFERVVFDMNRQPLLAGDEARPLRHRPALQDAIELKAEIVVEAARRMLLDDIGIAAFADAPRAGGLGRAREVTLRAIGIEGLVHRRNSRRIPDPFPSLQMAAETLG